MAYYSINNDLAGTKQNLSTTYKTQVALTAATATLKRALVSDIMFGAFNVPNATDCAISYDVSRQTAAGTSTAGTPTLLNPADAASGTVGALNFTIEGTITATSSVLALSINQRASQRWVAAPGSELVIPATNLNGLAMRALSTNYASTVLVHAIFQDM